MKQITITDEMYESLLAKLKENTYCYGLTALEYAVIENTIDIEESE